MRFGALCLAIASCRRIARHDGGQTMQNQFITALLIALTLAWMVTISTCHHFKRTGELRTKEAQQEAETWKMQARAYAETLERAEEAHRRAEQSHQDYLKNIETAETREYEARQIVDEMRKDAGDCVWLDDRVPDRVRDIIQNLYARPDCDRAQAPEDTAGTLPIGGTDRH